MPTGFFDVLSILGVTFPSPNVTSGATVGFEEKDDRQTLYVHITESTFETDLYASLALGIAMRTVTAAQAKTLPGVTAGETIRLTCEMFADALTGGRTTDLQVDFYNESGVQQGATQTISVNEAATWEMKNSPLTVPSGATRVNFYVHAHCAPDETVQLWISALKIVRI